MSNLATYSRCTWGIIQNSHRFICKLNATGSKNVLIPSKLFHKEVIIMTASKGVVVTSSLWNQILLYAAGFCILKSWNYRATNMRIISRHLVQPNAIPAHNLCLECLCCRLFYIITAYILLGQYLALKPQRCIIFK